MFHILVLAGAAIVTQPLNLVLESEGEQTRLLVVGESAVPLLASYELEASSGTGNRSVQSGTVRLVPRKRVVLVTLSMGGSSKSWNATLKVSHEAGSYEQVKTGD